MKFHIGLDTSLRGCALAVLSTKGTVFAGSLPLGAKVRGGERLDRIRTFLRSHLPRASVVSGAIEGPSLGSVHREFDLGEVSGVARQLVYERYALELVVVPPTQLKLYAAGHGHAEDLIHAVKEHFGHDAGDDDDEADAFALAHLARALTRKTALRRCEAQVVHDILSPKTVTPAIKHRRTKENI